MIEHEIIKDYALGMEVGDTNNFHCPFCNVTHEDKLYVTREIDGLVYQCKRASCGAHGFIPGVINIISSEYKEHKKQFNPKLMDFDLEEVPNWLKDKLYLEHYITDNDIEDNRFMYAPKNARLIMPVYNLMGDCFGHVGKYYGQDEKIRKKWKTINYFTKETSKLHYPQPYGNNPGPVVVVEDILSSVRMRHHTKTVALLGHGLNDKQVVELRLYSDEVILALDGDVIQTALKYKKKYGFLFRNFSVKYLSQDVKSMTDKQIQEEILG